MDDLPAEPAEPPSGLEHDKESVRLYRRLRELLSDGRLRRAHPRARRQQSGSEPYSPGRDPSGLGDVFETLADDLGWRTPLARSEVLIAWPEMVGEELAAHSSPVSVDDAVLTIQCDSTAWATQLRLIRSVLLESMAKRYPEAGITSVRVLGPDVPSWKRGPRSIPGRGPRDTYG